MPGPYQNQTGSVTVTNMTQLSNPPQSNGSKFASNIPKYFAYIALKGLGFAPFGVLWVIFLQQQRGMTLAQAALVDVTFFVSAAFGEIPTGIVADTLGRKTSMAIGAGLMALGALGWTFAPTMPLIMLAYTAMGIGFTFQSGAEDALLYESVQLAGRGDDYTRLTGRANAIFMGALAVGSVAGGLLASIKLVLPFIIAILLMLCMLVVVLTLKEPQAKETSVHERKSFGQILRQSVALMRARPTLRYPMIYLALVPLASFVVELIFLQPQALALGVPIAGIGVLVMALQIVNMFGSNGSDWIKTRFGEERVLYLAPVIILGCVLLLAAFQVFPALLLIAVAAFFNAALRPIILNRIQSEVSDEVRATILSMQSLMFTVVGAIAQPTLAYVADQAGLPTAYLALAGSLTAVVFLLFWISRPYFPRAEAVPQAQVDFG